MSYGYAPLQTPNDPLTGQPQFQVVYGQPQLVKQQRGLYPSYKAGLQNGGCGATPTLPYARYAYTPMVEPLPMVNRYPYPKNTGQGWANVSRGVAFPTASGKGFRTAYEAIAQNVGFQGPVTTY